MSVRTLHSIAVLFTFMAVVFIFHGRTFHILWPYFSHFLAVLFTFYYRTFVLFTFHGRTFHISWPYFLYFCEKLFHIFYFSRGSNLNIWCHFRRLKSVMIVSKIVFFCHISRSDYFILITFGHIACKCIQVHLFWEFCNNLGPLVSHE